MEYQKIKPNGLPMDFITVDSGKRDQFKSGAKRDIRIGKGRFDLIPPYPLIRLANLYERGAEKYGDNNWQKGIPISRCYDSAMRHLIKYRAGETQEDHLAACIWNLMTIMDTERRMKENKLPTELNDLIELNPTSSHL